MKKILLLIILLFVVSACSSVPEMSENLCNSGGGHWNECGSPCTGTGSDFCIDVCEPICECAGLAGFNCPKGYSCQVFGNVADGFGKCILD